MAIVLELANQSVVDIFFADQSGFSLEPYVPYGWQPKGEQWIIPSRRKKVMNVMGFLNPLTDQLLTYELPENCTMDSEKFIEFVDDFVTKITRPTVLVIDRASYHTSKLTRSKFKEWAEQDLYILYLPPRSPHFNKIETLWRKIKREWLNIRDFYSEKTLKKKLISIFKKYGLDYCIKFSMNFVFTE